MSGVLDSGGGGHANLAISGDEDHLSSVYMYNVSGGTLSFDFALNCFLYGGSWVEITATENSQSLSLFPSYLNTAPTWAAVNSCMLVGVYAPQGKPVWWATNGMETMSMSSFGSRQGAPWAIGTLDDQVLRFMQNSNVCLSFLQETGQGQWAVGSAERLQSPTWGATVTPDAALGNTWLVAATSGVAWGLAAPLNAITGQRCTLLVRNISGGSIGAVAFNPIWKQVGYVNPANGESTAADFVFDGGSWVQVSSWTNAVPA